MIVFNDKNTGHIIKFKKFKGSFYYFYSNSEIEFIYPERIKFVDGNISYKKRNNLLLKFDLLKDNLYDVTLFGFYKNKSLKKNMLRSVNGKVAKSIKLNSQFFKNSFDHFKKQNIKFKIISPITYDDQINYINRINFWKNQGFSLLNKSNIELTEYYDFWNYELPTYENFIYYTN